MIIVLEDPKKIAIIKSDPLWFGGVSVVAWRVNASVCLHWSCGDMGCIAVAPADGELWE